MRYLSICSGIEAASAAWHPLGWTPAAFAEIDPFPSAVLAHRFPDVPNLGDFTQIEASDVGPIDLLVGGTPCQSFSVAGLRGGLDDDRGNLALEFFRLAQRTKPRWIVWENVPGVLSSNGGRDFGAILGALAELRYGFAYRVLDAQYVRVDEFPGAVPQRRRRVFVVGYLGDWRRAAAVLFEPESVRGHPAPRRETRQVAAGSASARTGGAVCANSGDVGYCLTASAQQSLDAETETLVAYAIQERAVSENPDAGPQGAGFSADGAAYTIEARNKVQAIAHGWAVRRLTPTECERLQGFPDGWTQVPYRRKPETADGPRYKAIGNSMAVNVMRWIGQRIAICESLCVPTTQPRRYNTMKPEAMEQFFTSMAAAHAHQSAAAEALTVAFNAIYGARESGPVVPALTKAEIRAAEAVMVAEVAKPKPAPKAKADVIPIPVEPTPEPVAEVAPIVETKPEPVKVEAKPEPVAEVAPTDAKLDINDVRKLLIEVQTMHSVGGDISQGRRAAIAILKEHADGEIGLPKVATKYYPAIAAACQASLAAGAV